MTEQTAKRPDNKSGGSNKLVLGLIVLAVVVVGSLAAIRFGMVTPPGWLLHRLPPALLPATSMLTGLGTEEAKLAAMIESGRSGTCTITNKDNPQEQIIYYIQGEKMRIEITNVNDNLVVTSYMVNDGEYNYTWSSESDQGTKTKAPSKEEIAEIEERLGEIQDYNFDWDYDAETDEKDNHEVKCVYKNLPNSTFVPPSNIEYMDFSQMMDSSSYYPEEAEGEVMPTEEDMAGLEKWAEEMREKYDIDDE